MGIIEASVEQLLTTFFLLLGAHFLADFVLQTDFIAREKNPKTAKMGKSTYILFMHCYLHASLTMLITRSWLCAFVMLASHYVIDEAKNNEAIDFVTDQVLHVTIIVFLTFISYFVGLGKIDLAAL